MVDLFNNEVIVQYQTAFENVVKSSAQHTINEFLSEFNTEKVKISEIIMKKYECLS